MDEHRAPAAAKSWPKEQADLYRHGEERPLGGYLQLMSIYASGTGVAAGIARLTGRKAPRLSPWDVVQLTAATPGTATP
jgi:hypothetical protein